MCCAESNDFNGAVYGIRPTCVFQHKKGMKRSVWVLREMRMDSQLKTQDSSWGELPLVLCPHLIAGSVAMEAGWRERQTGTRGRHHHVSDSTEMGLGCMREEVVEERIRRRVDAD